MTITSDTIYYREDGTISSVQRTTRVQYTKPSGVLDFENATSEVSLGEFSQHLDSAAVVFESRNRELEAQIAAERAQAAAVLQSRNQEWESQLAAERTEAANAKAAAVEQLSTEIARLNALLAEQQ